MTPPRTPDRNAPETARRIGGLKLWGFRLAAVVLAPVLLFLILEAVLRMVGFGYPTSFLLTAQQHGRKEFVSNSRFGWRFFGAELARQPPIFAVPEVKSTNTVRIFVFGESAAYGDPQPEFGLPRMLEALLNLRYPGTRFEVVNAAMTAINSHGVLAIARDCTRAAGDVWVVYMGNNEVVGPFGAGTVFGPQAPGLPLVRTTLALKTTRTGEFLDQALRSWHKPPEDKSEWGGMLMFLGNQVRQDDPRMDSVYHNFEQNLGDILRAGRRQGARIVVSTVAVNLKDCAPFASSHRARLSDDQQARWQKYWSDGNTAGSRGDHAEAARCYQAAATIDDAVADLQFTWAWTCLGLGNTTEARQRFSLARDLDVLRFRCDSRLNEITRRVALEHAGEGVLLSDAEESFWQASPQGVPGADWFYEHVHLTFEGNYLLARTIATQVAQCLPEKMRDATLRPWPSPEECAQRLAFTDWNRLNAISDILGRLSDPPFTYQINHADQMRYLSQEAQKLQAGAQIALQQAPTIYHQALTNTPDDAVLFGELAAMLAAAGDAREATESARRIVELLPNSTGGWMELGRALAQQQQYEAAAEKFVEAFRQDPNNFWAVQDLAHTYARMGRRDDAIREYRRAIALKPHLGTAYLALGQLLEDAGQKAEAEQDFHQALRYRIHRTGELLALARFCQNRGWLDAAATNFVDAVKLSPSDPKLWLETAQCLDAAGRHDEAEQCFAEAVRLRPDSVEAHFLFGLEFGRRNKSSEAAEQFGEVVRLMPDLVEGRVNLGIALMRLGKNSDAAGQFEEALRRNPTNAEAIKNLHLLQVTATATGKPGNP